MGGTDVRHQHCMWRSLATCWHAFQGVNALLSGMTGMYNAGEQRSPTVSMLRCESGDLHSVP